MQPWLLLGARMRSWKDFYSHLKWGLGSLWCRTKSGVMQDWPAPSPSMSYHTLVHSSLPRLFMCFPFISLSNVYAVYSFACAKKQADLPEEASNLSNLLISQSSELENWAQFFLFPRISAAKRGQEKTGKALKTFSSDMWYRFWVKYEANNF